MRIGARVKQVTLQELTDNKFLSIAEAERETGISRAWIYAYLTRNRIPALTLFARFRVIARQDLDHMMKLLEEPGEKEKRIGG